MLARPFICCNRWLTVPEAAVYAKMTEHYMAQLVYGKQARTGRLNVPDEPLCTLKSLLEILGFARGARVKQSAIDAYLIRHAYRKK